MGVEPTWDAQHPTDGFEDRGAHRDSSTPKTYPRVTILWVRNQHYQIKLSFFCQEVNGINPPIANQWREDENIMNSPINIIGISK